MGRTLVIAEAGSCHDGQLLKALRLVNTAFNAGADVVKFQYYSDPDRLADRRRVPDSYREIYRRYQMPPVWLPVLRDYIESQDGKPELMCSTYLPEDVAVVASYVQRFKIASFEALDEEFIVAHARFKKPIILSTGMMSEHDLLRFWMGGEGFKILHCVSAYPAPPEAMNLAVLLGGEFSGISDHSRHVWMGALAVAAGAEIIEAHLRLNDTDPENPDYATAFTPSEFAEYVKNVRFAEACLGDGEKKLQACEEPMAKFRVKGN
jgi:sialic acid synthase SpsE